MFLVAIIVHNIRLMTGLFSLFRLANSENPPAYGLSFSFPNGIAKVDHCNLTFFGVHVTFFMFVFPCLLGAR